MSRREGRDSESRRYRSRFDQEPSPKRSRRDGKPETQRPPSGINLDSRYHSDCDQKHRCCLQDALPLEAPIKQVSKEEDGAVSKVSDKANVNPEGTKNPLDPTEVPWSRSYFQHDELCNSGQVNRSFSHRAPTGKERGWWRDPKEQQSERTQRISTGDMPKKDERSRVHGEDRDAWSHDRYFEMETDRKPLARKRPSFREKKIPDDYEKADKAMEEPLKTNANEDPVLENEKREDRGYNSRHLVRSERSFAGNREANKGEAWRGNFQSRDGHGSRSGNYRGRERFTPRQGYQPRVEKWKHDLFDMANRSPSPKNEEDAVAKVEALLAS